MFLTVPEAQAPADIRVVKGGSTTLAAGTKVTISLPADDSPRARYSFVPGDKGNPLAPARLALVGAARAPFVNTSVRFLNGFDCLYDADGGLVGLRWTGHAPPAVGQVSSQVAGQVGDEAAASPMAPPN
jgi:hypothetical protein